MTEAAIPAVAYSVLTVQVGEECFTLRASEVAEVIRTPVLTRVPLAPASLLGVSNLRGAVMPVVSLRTLLGTAGRSPANARVVVINGDSPVGLLIDKVASVADVTDGTVGEAGASVQPIDMDALLSKDFARFTQHAPHRHSLPTGEHRKPESVLRDEVTLVCFDVAGQDYALPLTSVHEVMAIPAGITTVPHTDAVMLGVMPYRGQLLPLVSLRELLGLRTRGQDNRQSRVIVARLMEGMVGLVADRMKEIFCVSFSEIDPVPSILTRGVGEAKIQGICRLEGGHRLVSTLSADHLFKDQTLMGQIMSQTGKSHEMETTESDADGDEQFIVFQLGGEEYGLPIASVDEVVRVPATLTRLPKAPAFIEGVMNMRGRIVPVIDQRKRFQFGRQGDQRRERIIVVTINHMQAGFVVDTVSEVLKVPATQLRSTPDLAASGAQVIDRIANIEFGGRMILLINPRELLDKAEADLLAAMGENTDRPTS